VLLRGALKAGVLTLGRRVPRSAKSWSSSVDDTDPDALGDGVTMGAWYCRPKSVTMGLQHSIECHVSKHDATQHPRQQQTPDSSSRPRTWGEKAVPADQNF
jgi:hypothetical protein